MTTVSGAGVGRSQPVISQNPARIRKGSARDMAYSLRWSKASGRIVAGGQRGRCTRIAVMAVVPSPSLEFVTDEPVTLPWQ